MRLSSLRPRRVRARPRAHLQRVHTMSAIEHRTIETNGIRMRIAEAGSGPHVLLCHGFPESWYSWRHQLRAFADAGYHAVAPDMRGYGRTDAPNEIEAYDVMDLCGDVTGVIEAFDEESAVLVGHDWGAAVAWYCALLEPERFTALITMSVPWGPKADRSPLTRLRESYGENFFYMLYFQEPGIAEAELDPGRLGNLIARCPAANTLRFLAKFTSGRPTFAPMSSIAR